MRVILASLIVSCAVSVAAAATSDEAYLAAYGDMGRQAAAWAASQRGLADSRSSMVTAWANAQAVLAGARATMVKSVADANSTNAKTLQTVEQTRGIAMDNDLKAAKTFYEKRKLHDGYRAMDARKRPTREDLVRYARQRSPSDGVQAPPGVAVWPPVLGGPEYLEWRVRATDGQPAAVEAMRGELQSRIREMSPAEYMAARKFIDSLNPVTQ